MGVEVVEPRVAWSHLGEGLVVDWLGGGWSSSARSLVPPWAGSHGGLVGWWLELLSP